PRRARRPERRDRQRALSAAAGSLSSSEESVAALNPKGVCEKARVFAAVCVSPLQSFQASECCGVQKPPRPLELESFAWVGFVDNVPSPTGNRRFHGSFANRRGSVARLAATIARNPHVIRGLPRWGLE